MSRSRSLPISHPKHPQHKIYWYALALHVMHQSHRRDMLREQLEQFLSVQEQKMLLEMLAEAEKKKEADFVTSLDDAYYALARRAALEPEPKLEDFEKSMDAIDKMHQDTWKAVLADLTLPPDIQGVALRKPPVPPSLHTMVRIVPQLAQYPEQWAEKWADKSKMNAAFNAIADHDSFGKKSVEARIAILEGVNACINKSFEKHSEMMPLLQGLSTHQMTLISSTPKLQSTSRGKRPGETDEEALARKEREALARSEARKRAEAEAQQAASHKPPSPFDVAKTPFNTRFTKK